MCGCLRPETAAAVFCLVCDFYRNTETTKNHEAARMIVTNDNETAKPLPQAGGMEAHKQTDLDLARRQVGQDVSIVGGKAAWQQL